MSNSNEKRLFWACFTALISTAFGFIVRALIMDEWGRQFGLSPTQKGEIFGVGLWPFAISIVLFSLVIDRIGYGPAMVFAFVCQVASAVITMCAPLVLAKEGATADQVAAGQTAGYWMLYVGNLVVALGNGTVEAVINPVVATMFPREKTKWLNILHAGWPGGLVLGGILAIGMSDGGLISGMAGRPLGWEYKVALILIPILLYGVLMLGCTFPVNERVAAGIGYKEMLQEGGILGALVVVALMVREVGRVFDLPLPAQLAIGALLVVAYGAYVRSLGRPMFFLLLLIMIPLATTELGTDSWITGLMEPEMKKLQVNAGWILVYTSFIMMVLRFFAGPIVHKLSPLGLLALSSGIAALGLVSLSLSTGFVILAAATLYGFGKTFFWPTMLGVVSEQFPRGGALTLNTISGVGMLGVGVVGAALLGNIQDKEIDKQLAANKPALHKDVMAAPKNSVFGEYQPLDQKKVDALSEADKKEIENVEAGAKKSALFTVALFPCIMLAGYLGLIFYFRARGGYKPVEINTGHSLDKVKELSTFSEGNGAAASEGIQHPHIQHPS